MDGRPNRTNKAAFSGMLRRAVNAALDDQGW